MTNSADPDQLASEGAKWYGSKLFSKAEYIRVQQDKGEDVRGILWIILTCPCDFQWLKGRIECFCTMYINSDFIRIPMID